MRLRLALALALAGAACKKTDAPEHLEKAKTALFQRNPDLALLEFKAALDLLERDTSPQAQVNRARALRGAADTYFFELRDYKKATQVYRELIQLCPEAPETLDGRIHLATLLRRDFHDLRGAIAEFAPVLDALKKFPDVWAVMTPANRVRLMGALIEEVLVDEKKGEVTISMIDFENVVAA